MRSIDPSSAPPDQRKRPSTAPVVPPPSGRHSLVTECEHDIAPNPHPNRLTEPKTPRPAPKTHRPKVAAARSRDSGRELASARTSAKPRQTRQTALIEPRRKRSLKPLLRHCRCLYEQHGGSWADVGGCWGIAQGHRARASR